MKPSKIKKMPEEKRKIVEAHPQVVFLAQIKIMDEKKPVAVGGFSIDGGFYLREGFNLIRQKSENVMGEKMTYFNFVKDPKKKGTMEKVLLKHKKEEIRWKKKREKELQKELDDLKKKK